MITTYRRALRTAAPSRAPASSGYPRMRRCAAGPHPATDACCCICVESLDGDPERHTVATLSCGHAFHAACLHKWLIVDASCPICRHAVPAYARDGGAQPPHQQDTQIEASIDFCMRAAVGAIRALRRLPSPDRVLSRAAAKRRRQARQRRITFCAKDVADRARRSRQLWLSMPSPQSSYASVVRGAMASAVRDAWVDVMRTAASLGNDGVGAVPQHLRHVEALLELVDARATEFADEESDSSYELMSSTSSSSTSPSASPPPREHVEVGSPLRGRHIRWYNDDDDMQA